MNTASNITNKTKRSLSANASPEDIQAEVETIRANIASLGKTVASYGKAKAGDIRSKATDKSADVVAASEQALAELQVQLDSLSRNVEQQVRAKPLQSLAIAAGIGFVISLLARR